MFYLPSAVRGVALVVDLLDVWDSAWDDAHI